MSSTSLSGAWQLNEKWSLRGGLGMILDGTLSVPGEADQTVNPGGLLALGVEYLALIGDGYKPFVDLSLFLSGSKAETEDPNTSVKTSYVSSDLRLGGRATWNVNDRVFPFVSARVFGGPVNWTLNDNDVTGSDIHHYQVALGTAIQFDQVGTFIEWVGFGEKALSVGMSYAWPNKDY